MSEANSKQKHPSTSISAERTQVEVDSYPAKFMTTGNMSYITW